MDLCQRISERCFFRQRRIRRAGKSLLLAMALPFLMASALAADERPSAIAPYRYPAPTNRPLDSLEQQKALGYRNELEAQRLQLERNRSSRTFDPQGLRKLGDTNRELGRVDRFLQR